MATYTNPTIDQEISPKQVFYPDNKVGIFTCNGSPEGVVLANTGSIALSDNGSVYKKTTDDINTGWVELQSGTITSPAVISGTNPTLSLVDTTVGDDDGSISMQADVMTITVVGGTAIQLKPSGFLIGIEKTIQTSFGAVGANVGAGLTTLFSGNIPVNFLAANNDYSVLFFGGSFAANDNDKRLQLTIGGTVLYNTALIDLDTFGYGLIVTLGRIDATHLAMNAFTMLGETAITSAAVVTSTGFLGEVANAPSIVVADLSVNPLTILLEAQGTANNDILLNEVVIKVCQMS